VVEQKLTGRSAGPAGPDAAVPDGGGDQQRQVLIDVLLSYTFVCLGVDLQRSVRFLFVSSPGFQVGLYRFISNDFCQIDYRNIYRTDLHQGPGLHNILRFIVRLSLVYRKIDLR